MPELWPGGKGLVLKKHRLGWLFSQRLGRASADRGGPIGRPAGRPYKDRKFSRRAKTGSPPVPWNKGRLMVFEQKAFAPGPGTPAQATFRNVHFPKARRVSAVIVAKSKKQEDGG